MTTQEKKNNGRLTKADIGLRQNNFAEKIQRIEKDIFNILKNIASNVAEGSVENMGAIVVFGDFLTLRDEYLIQMKPKKNPLKFPVDINTTYGVELIKIYSKEPYDGAVVVNKDGKIIGVGIYLVVKHPNLEIPDDCGTRHKSAASFSSHNDVISVLTLSEETNTVRLWRNGKEEQAIEVKGDT